MQNNADTVMFYTSPQIIGVGKPLVVISQYELGNGLRGLDLFIYMIGNQIERLSARHVNVEVSPDIVKDSDLLATTKETAEATINNYLYEKAIEIGRDKIPHSLQVRLDDITSGQFAFLVAFHNMHKELRFINQHSLSENVRRLLPAFPRARFSEPAIVIEEIE